MKKVAALAAIGIISRIGFVLSSSRALDVPVLDLALRYDGHVYLRIAKSLPWLYVEGDSPFLTGWFPLYPVLVRVLAFFVPDYRLSAILVSLSFSALSVFLFHRLAARFSRRPDLATLLFLFFPPMWLVVGGLGFVEPLLVASVLLAVLSVLEDRPAPLALACAAAVLTQKSGFLVPVIAVLMDRRKWAVALVPAGLAVALLQGYLLFAFGDLFINLKVQREVFGGALFGVPFLAFARGAVSPSAFGGALRCAAIAASGVFYLAACWKAPRALRPWLWSVCGFFFCLGGDWAFHSLPRFLLLAAPAAVLTLEPLVAANVLLAPLVLLPFFVGLLEASQAGAFWLKAWGAGYAEHASRELR